MLRYWPILVVVCSVLCIQAGPLFRTFALVYPNLATAARAWKTLQRRGDGDGARADGMVPLCAFSIFG